MEERTNAGYRITDRIHVGESEFVLGVHMNVGNQFVTWKCRDGSDYFWGRYFSSQLDAQKNLVQRAYEEVRYLEERQESRHKGKEMER